MKRFFEKHMTLNQQYGMAQFHNIIRILLDYGIDFDVNTEEKIGGHILKIITFKNYYFYYDGEFPVHKIGVLLRTDIIERQLGDVKITEGNVIRFFNLEHDEILEVDSFKGVDVIFNSIVQ